MAKISRVRNSLRRIAHMRDYGFTLRDLRFLPSSRQARKRVQHRIAVSAVALDKIRPLSHLHSSRHLIDLRSLRQGQEPRIESECAKRPGQARLKIENRQIRS